MTGRNLSSDMEELSSYRQTSLKQVGRHMSESDNRGTFTFMDDAKVFRLISQSDKSARDGSS